MDPELVLHFRLTRLIVPALSVVCLIGGLAVVSPDRFACMTRKSNKWPDTSKRFALLEGRMDIDEPVPRYSRCFGLAIVLGTLFVACVFATRVLGASPF